MGISPVRFGRGGQRGRTMVKGGHRGAAGGRHWAGGLHSCVVLLLIGTTATNESVIR